MSLAVVDTSVLVAFYLSDDPRRGDVIDRLTGFPIRRMPLAPFLDRIWELRANVTAYGAAYIALAEKLDAPVITCEARSATASGSRCTFEVIA